VATLIRVFGQIDVGEDAVEDAFALALRLAAGRYAPQHGWMDHYLGTAVRRRGGTIYPLGREDPYASASSLMTAVAEHVLDTALGLANISPWGRLCPPLLACLDELPSTAPLPTLQTRMANGRALGISFIYAAQTWPQLAAIFGEHQARALFGLTNVLVMFGGSKDGAFNHEISNRRAGPGRPTDLADRSNGRPRLLRGRYCDPAPRGDPPTFRTRVACSRRERQTHHRPTGSLHRRQSRTPAPGRAAAAAHPANRKTSRAADG
jgi:hypothetical protein